MVKDMFEAVSLPETLMQSPMHPYTHALIAAVPVPDPRARALRAAIGGEPPDPFNLLVGCGFQARCPHADDNCRTDPPAFRPVGNKHMVACHYAETLATAAAENTAE